VYKTHFLHRHHKDQLSHQATEQPFWINGRERKHRMFSSYQAEIIREMGNVQTPEPVIFRADSEITVLLELMTLQNSLGREHNPQRYESHQALVSHIHVHFPVLREY
jgi:hypothetical protein